VLLPVLPSLKTAALSMLTGFLLGVAVTHWINGLQRKADQLQVVKNDLSVLSTFIKKDRDNYVLADGLSREAEKRANETVERIRIVERRIPYEVVKYVDSNPLCNLPAGALGLLNAARRLSDPDAADRGEAVPLADEEGRTPTDFGQQEEIAEHADCATRYAELANRHNALISLPLAIIPEKEEAK
jgi:hypothetical protein